MVALWGYYRAQFRVSLAIQFQYRVAMVIWMIGLVLEPIIYLVVWTTVARSSGGSVGGYNVGDFTAYYIILMIVSHINLIWHMWEYEYYIREGILAARLLRPLHPIHQDAAENIAYKFLMLGVLIPAVIITSIVFHPIWVPPIWAIVAFLPAVILSGVLSFMVGWMVATGAFWTTRTIAVGQTYFVAMFFFSGQVAPLELLPPFLQMIANVLPFRWMVGFPVELLLGRLSPEQTLSGFVAQAFWLTVSFVMMRLIWRVGVRHFSAVGG